MEEKQILLPEEQRIQDRASRILVLPLKGKHVLYIDGKSRGSFDSDLLIRSHAPLDLTRCIADGLPLSALLPKVISNQ